jgi:hypothetical protein
MVLGNVLSKEGNIVCKVGKVVGNVVKGKV